MNLLIYGSEKLVMRFYLCMPDKGSTNRTGDRLISIEFKHAFDTLVTEEMLVRACEHRPSPHDVVGFKADITKIGV